MVEHDPVALGVLLVLLAFVPPLIYVIIVRNVERHRREPWRAVFGAFFFGAIVSVFLAILLSLFLDTNFNRPYELVYGHQSFVFQEAIILAIVIAPVVEEFTKGLGVGIVRRHIDELEDGIIYGAAAGLGFSATENLLYELSSLLEHQDLTFVAVAGLRAITSSFLHATASGILGYGIARRAVHGGIALEVFPYYALAVLLHAAYNALASFVSVQGVPLAGIAFIILVSILGIRWTLRRIRHHDRHSQPAIRP